MSLLNVTAQQFNTYVTLKLQNVKSTTVTVKGATPCWEQDFLFETNDINIGLLIEVWNKGVIWDRAVGYNWVPLQTVQFLNEISKGKWYSLDAELVMKDDEVIGTKNPTGHSILIDCGFELPFAGYSEDSDYTSDLNYPVGQHANSSASQFRSVANHLTTSPDQSAVNSRDNSYDLLPINHDSQSIFYNQTQAHQQSQSYQHGTYDQYEFYDNMGNHDEVDNLYYNSRPSKIMSDNNKRNFLYYEDNHLANFNQKNELVRNHSLQRQNSLCDYYNEYDNDDDDDYSPYNSDPYYYSNDKSKFSLRYKNYHKYNYNNEDEEYKQWDSGGKRARRRILPRIPQSKQQQSRRKLPTIPKLENGIRVPIIAPNTQTYLANKDIPSLYDQNDIMVQKSRSLPPTPINQMPKPEIYSQHIPSVQKTVSVDDYNILNDNMVVLSDKQKQQTSDELNLSIEADYSHNSDNYYNYAYQSSNSDLKIDDDIDTSNFNITDESDELLAASYFHALNEKRRMMLKQTTDSLESHDDDYKKSFETSSDTQQNQHQSVTTTVTTNNPTVSTTTTKLDFRDQNYDNFNSANDYTIYSNLTNSSDNDLYYSRTNRLSIPYDYSNSVNVLSSDNFIVGPLTAKIISPITEEDDDEVKKHTDGHIISPPSYKNSSIPVTVSETEVDSIPITDTVTAISTTSERKSVSFWVDKDEDDGEKEVKREITARQRWLWAFNKIIMQINVSNFSLIIYKCYEDFQRITYLEIN